MKICWALIFLIMSKAFASVYVDMELNEVTLPQAVKLVYTEALKQPFMVDPKLVKDPRLVTFKLTRDVEAKSFLTRYLLNMGVKIFSRDGVDYISPFVPKEPIVPCETLVYHPKFRSAGYLSSLLRSQFEGSLPGEQGKSIGVSITHSDEMLVFYGPKVHFPRLRSILSRVDVVADEVLVTGYVFEVQKKQQEGSGLLLAAKLISSKLSIDIGASQGLENVLRFKAGGVDALCELLSSDGRFRVISAPILRVRNTAKATFSVGQEVPVLSKVSYSKGERPIQSIEYRSSGVIFDVVPKIYRDAVDLSIRQQLSNFVKTDTGVNNTPTLIKREVTTEVMLSQDDVVLLGGLAEAKNSSTSSGLPFLPKVLGSVSKENHSTDILFLLQVKRVKHG